MGPTRWMTRPPRPQEILTANVIVILRHSQSHSTGCALDVRLTPTTRTVGLSSVLSSRESLTPVGLGLGLQRNNEMQQQ